MYVIASSRSQIIHAPEDHCGVKTTELVRLDKSSDIKKAFFFFHGEVSWLGFWKTHPIWALILTLPFFCCSDYLFVPKSPHLKMGIITTSWSSWEP